MSRLRSACRRRASAGAFSGRACVAHSCWLPPVSSISSGSIAAASRHRASAARACAGDAPARPQAGVITACSATVASGRPSLRHSRRARSAVCRGPARLLAASRRDRPGQQPQARLGRLGHPVLFPPPQLAEVEGEPVRSRPLDYAERDRGGTAVHHGVAAGARQHLAQPVLHRIGLDRGQPGQPALGRHQARGDGGSAGSSNWTTSRAPGTRLATSAACAAAPSASEAIRSATAPGIGQRHVHRACAAPAWRPASRARRAGS